MILDTSSCIRVVVSTVVIAVTIFCLKLVFCMISEGFLFLALIVPLVFTEPFSKKDAIFQGFLIGLGAGVLLSVLYLAPLAVATVIFIVFSILGTMLSWFLRRKRLINS